MPQDDDWKARWRDILSLALTVPTFFATKGLTGLIPDSDEWEFLLGWIVPIVAAALVQVVIAGRPVYEVRWHVSGLDVNDGGYSLVDLRTLKAARLGEIEFAASLVVRYASIFGWLMASRAAKRGYWVELAFDPPDIVALKPQLRSAPGAAASPDRRSVRLDIRHTHVGKQQTRFTGTLTGVHLQPGRDKVEFVGSLHRQGGSKASVWHRVTSTLEGLDVRS